MPTFDINLTGVQENLVSGTNIKTINGESVLGSGDLDVSQDISGIATNASAITTIQGEQTTQDAAIALNTAKNSYPSADATKLAGIEAGAEVNDTAVEIKTKYESNADTNAFTDSEKSNLANQSGTNTGDQDLSGLQETLVSGTNIKTINGESVLGSGDLTVGGGVSFGTDGQIPYVNAANDDLAYSNWLLRTDNTLTINQTADSKGFQ